MTPAEAIAALEAASDEMTFSATEQCWRYTFDNGQPPMRETKYVVSVQPRKIDGTCEHYFGETMALAVAQAIASLPLTQTQSAIAQVAAKLEGGK